MKNRSSQRTIRFINTFTPVVPLYETIFPLLEECGWQPLSLESRGIYRRKFETRSINNSQETVWVPAFLRYSKRWCALFFLLLAPFHLLFKPKTVNLFLTQPPLFFILGAWISRFTRVKYAIHIMDMHPELLVHSGILNPKGILFRVFSRLAFNALRHAELIIVIGRCMKQRLVRKGLQPSKIRTIPNWGPHNIIPIGKKENLFRQKYQLERKFIILYSGNMGIPHEFATILDVAQKCEHQSDILFLFIGQGAKRQEIERAIASGATNLLLMDFQPKSMLPYSLSAADVHFFSLRSGFEGLVVPSKFYGMLASGKPVIYEGVASGEVAQVLKESDTGKVIEPDNVEQLYENIIYYYRNQSVADQDGQRGYRTYVEKFKESTGAKAYVDALLRDTPGLIEAQK